jgi:phage shock protein C
MYCSTCGREIVNESNFCYLCGARQTSATAYANCYPRPHRRLERSVTDCKIAGVCGGLAEYWDMDPTMVRLIAVLLVLFPVPFVPAILGYFVAWIVIPKAEYPVYAPAPSQVPQAGQQTQSPAR